MRLIIQFTDEALADFRWANYDEVSGSAELDWRTAADSELAAVASQNPNPVIIVIPQQCVYLNAFTWPRSSCR
jgi:hypothetical protein